MRGSDCLLGYDGPNPFRDSQARDYADDKVVGEFFPTSSFWSLFNDQNEILLGTRGSGKTVLLRMLSYSCLRRCTDAQAIKHIAEKRFIGFYIPVHLEWISSLRGRDIPDEEKQEYFNFALNCLAAIRLLKEIRTLVTDLFDTSLEQVAADAKLTSRILSIWYPAASNKVACISDLTLLVSQTWNSQHAWRDGELAELPVFARAPLSPIAEVLPYVMEDLGLDPSSTTWLACIDEAEFLPIAFLRSINTLLRSEKRPLAVKIATLPSKHSTRETSVYGQYIEPNGNDFNYRVVDLPWDSRDFENLTDHFCSMRLLRTGIDGTFHSLEHFLGRIGRSDSQIDYYLHATRKKKTDSRSEIDEKSAILEGIISSLSPARRRNVQRTNDRAALEKPIFQRFAPVFFVREMKKLDSQGHTKPGWFAGANVVRRASEGNPRRFIALMDSLVETARSTRLTAKQQHGVITKICDDVFTGIEGLPDYGPYAQALIKSIGQFLAEKTHGSFIVDSGCSFQLDESLLDSSTIRKALELAIDYSHIVSDSVPTCELGTTSNLRLSFTYAVKFWLPMRKSSKYKISAAVGIEILKQNDERLHLGIYPQRARDLIEGLRIGMSKR